MGRSRVIQLAPISDVVMIVDVLSFSTSGEIATNNGAIIFPYKWKDESALDYAKSLQATALPNIAILSLLHRSQKFQQKLNWFESDVELAASFNVSNCVPFFTGNTYVKQSLIFRE